MNKQIIIFLDIDGVLNNDSSNSSRELIMEPELLAHLRELVLESNASLVLSTSWRESERNRERINDCFKEAGIPSFISATPKLESNRVDEILWWLLNNTDFSEDHTLESLTHSSPKATKTFPSSAYLVRPQLHLVNWLVLDDVNLLKEGKHAKFLKHHFIHVNKKYGLTKSDIEKAKSLLK